MADLALDQPDIELEACHLGDDTGGVGHIQGDLCIRVSCHVARHDRHGKVVADAERGAHAERTRLAPVSKGLLQFAGSNQQLLGCRQQPATRFIQLQALADAVEQLQLELAFELRKGAAGGRLRQRQAGGGAPEVFLARGRDKYLELAQGVSHYL